MDTSETLSIFIVHVKIIFKAWYCVLLVNYLYYIFEIYWYVCSRVRHFSQFHEMALYFCIFKKALIRAYSFIYLFIYLFSQNMLQAAL